MAMRYERVTDPDGGQSHSVVESMNVYNPEQMDDCGPIMGDGGRRFLDPISLREMLYDPRINVNQRGFCVAAAIVFSFLLVILLLFIGIGFGRVMRDISIEEEKSNFGMQMIPNLRRHAPYTLFLSKTEEGKEQVKQYVEEMDTYIQKYKQEQDSRANWTDECAPGRTVDNRWCKLDLVSTFKQGEDGCTKSDNYGFDSGTPCILIAFNDEIGWTPRLNASNNVQLPMQCKVTSRFSSSSSRSVSVSYFPALETNSKYGGFQMNKLPSRTVVDDQGEEIADEDGETLYDQPPLVFVKLRPDSGVRYATVECWIVDTLPQTQINNLKDLDGLADIKFDLAIDQD